MMGWAVDGCILEITGGVRYVGIQMHTGNNAGENGVDVFV